MQLNRFSIVCLMSALVLFLAPAPSAGQAALQQQGQTVYTYVAQFRIAPAERNGFGSRFNQYAKPVLDRLLADDTLIEWGRSAPVVHAVDGMTDTIWWSATEVSRSLKVLDELSQAKMPPTTSEAHADMLLQSLVFETRRNEATGGYLYLSLFTARTGQTDRWMDAFNRYYRPIFAGLLTDGTILGYGVDYESVHTADPRNRYMWLQTADAESADKVEDAMAQARAVMSSAEREAMQATFDQVMIPETHRDSLEAVIEFHHK